MKYDIHTVNNKKSNKILIKKVRKETSFEEIQEKEKEPGKKKRLLQ